MIFADRRVLGGTGGIKIAEGGKAESVGMSEGFEGVLDVELGLTVGIDRRLRHRLDDRHAGGDAIGGAGGRENKFFYTVKVHRAEQAERGDHVVEIIFERVGDGFADVGERREMHDGLDFFSHEDIADRLFIAQIGCVVRHLGTDGTAVTED